MINPLTDKLNLDQLSAWVLYDQSGLHIFLPNSDEYMIFHVFASTYDLNSINGSNHFENESTRGPFLESPGNLTGPKSYFGIKVSRKVGCVLTSHEVHFVSLADNFTASFPKPLKLPSLMENKKSLRAR